MARYEHLPIYREAFDLALYFEKTVRAMARYGKYTLGAVMVQVCRAKVRCSSRWKSCPGKGRPSRVAIPEAVEVTKRSKPGRKEAT